MPNIWIISDTHFQHENMLNFKSNGVRFRGDVFSSQRDCDETMIQNWNSCVKPEDHVWHLGDVFMGSKEKFCNLWTRLNGKKKLIIGNHDDIRFLSGKNPLNDEWFFRKVELWTRHKDMIFTHVPMQLKNAWEGEKFKFNVHGHIHEKMPPTLRHFNACVEVNNWGPIHIEDLHANLKLRGSSI